MYVDQLNRELPQHLQNLLSRDESVDTPKHLPRRTFLKLAAASGFALGAFPLDLTAQQAGNTTGLKSIQQPLAFVHIAPDGTTTITINRLEFGQGVQTSLPMILADELDADWSKVKSTHGTNDPAYVDPVFGLHITGGSGSLAHSYVQYRELGARTRAMLMNAAAARWQLDVAKLRTSNGVVIAPNGQQLSYGELAESAMKLPVPEKVTLKDAKDFRFIGKPTDRLDSKPKSSGRQDFGIDVRLPGMLTAVIAKPPVFGAKLKSVDDKAAKAIKGVKAVLRIPVDRGGEGVAVVADGYWTAKQGRDALKLEWDTSQAEKVDSATQLAQYRELAKKPGLLKYDADVSTLGGAANTINAEFIFPYLAHAPMEPLNCTVSIKGNQAELWVGSQMPGLDSMAAAKILGVPPEKVMINVQMAGGGFGRRAVPTSDFVSDACFVAKAALAAGISVPIRTLWSREQDIKGGYYRPMHLHTAKIGFNAQGQITAWDHVIVGQSITAGTPFERMMLKGGIDNTATEGMKEPYEIPMRLTVHHPKVNVPVLWWRSVGSTHTAFVMETLIDEIARKTNQDPVAYRMKLFGSGHERHKSALQLAVDKSGYGRKKLAAGRAWGVAVHESFNSVVVYVVEASIKVGKPTLHTVTAGVHCNLVINPKSLEAQVQGCALMGLAMCLPGAAITLKDGMVEQSNFYDYRVPRMADMPEIAVYAVPSAEAPTGMGEPGLPPLAPAFANAITRLTGKALRELPFKI